MNLSLLLKAYRRALPGIWLGLLVFSIPLHAAEPQKILILTSRIGNGHVAVAQATEQFILDRTKDAGKPAPIIETLVIEDILYAWARPNWAPCGCLTIAEDSSKLSLLKIQT